MEGGPAIRFVVSDIRCSAKAFGYKLTFDDAKKSAPPKTFIKEKTLACHPTVMGWLLYKKQEEAAARRTAIYLVRKTVLAVYNGRVCDIDDEPEEVTRKPTFAKRLGKSLRSLFCGCWCRRRKE